MLRECLQTLDKDLSKPLLNSFVIDPDGLPTSCSAVTWIQEYDSIIFIKSYILKTGNIGEGLIVFKLEGFKQV